MSQPAVKKQLRVIFEVQDLKRRLADVPEVRAERVEKLRFLVETGRYHVSNEQLAGAMLESGVFGVGI